MIISIYRWVPELIELFPLKTYNFIWSVFDSSNSICCRNANSIEQLVTILLMISMSIFRTSVKSHILFKWVLPKKCRKMEADKLFLLNATYEVAKSWTENFGIDKVWTENFGTENTRLKFRDWNVSDLVLGTTPKFASKNQPLKQTDYQCLQYSLIKEISWRTSYNSLWGQNVGAIYVNRKQVYRKTIYILQLLITVSETNLCIWATIKLCRFIVIFQII